MGRHHRRCTQCNEKVRDLTAHVRSYHQLIMKIKFAGIEFSLSRADDGYFICPCEQYQTRNSDSLRTHIRPSCIPAHMVEDGHRSTDAESNHPEDGGTELMMDTRDDHEMGEWLGLGADAGDDFQEEGYRDFTEVDAYMHQYDDQDLHGDENQEEDEEEEEDEDDDDDDEEEDEDEPEFEGYIAPQILSAHIHTLSRCGLHADLDFNLVICLECSEALDQRHIHSHVTQHQLPCPSQEELFYLLDDLGIRGPPPLPTRDAIAPIAGLGLKDGLLCTTGSCNVPFASDRSLRRHNQECHMGVDLSSQPCKIHRIYGFRGTLLTVRVDPDLAIQRPHGSLAEYLSVMCPQDDRSLLPLNPSDDPRKTTSFLERSKWPEIVRGHSLDDLLSLVELPARDSFFHPVMQMVEIMFNKMGDEVEKMDVLSRRHIHTPTGNLDTSKLESKPFGRPQTEDHLLRCAKAWGRYICALLRSMDTSPRLLPLSPDQQGHCIEVLRALDDKSDLWQPIQSLSFSLISEYTPEVKRDNTRCPLNRFITFWHLREDGTFQSPTNTSPNLACLTYCFRAIAILDVLAHLNVDPDFTFIDYYVAFLLPLLKEGYPTPFNTLRQLTHLVSGHAYRSSKLPDMHWNRQRDTLSVKGYPVKLALIPKMIQALCSRAESLLDELLLGADRVAFDRVIDDSLVSYHPDRWPIDPLRNTDAGFSFVHSPDNLFHPFIGMVLQHIHSDPALFANYHLRDAQGRIVHKHAAFRAYFRLHHEFVDVLMVLAHMSTPGVARGTELGPLRAVNSIDGPRNFYFLSGACAIICQYLKTRSITGTDGYVAHFLPKSVSRFFIYLVGPIREVVTAFARHTFPESLQVYTDYLYVVGGETVASSAFSNVLRKYTDEHLNAPLTLAPFRQAIKAILRTVFHHRDDVDSPDDPMDASFGHSSFTGNTRYGLVYDDLPGLTENVYVDAMELASRYHSWLGLGSPPRSSSPTNPSSDGAPLSSDSLLPRMERVLLAIQTLRDQYRTDHADAENKIVERYLPTIQDTISTTLSHRVPWSTHLRPPPSPPSLPEPVLVHRSRLASLERVFRSQNHHFMSVEQGQAIELIFRRHPHLLVVLRTGGGKSAVYQAPSFSQESGFRVVIVPYVSLMDQALADASAKGIPHHAWSLSDPDVDVFKVKLVFAAVEHVAKEPFRDWLRSCFRAGYLNGIVVDEAHDVLLSRDYRDSFGQFTCLGEIGCQIVLLSATVSPSAEPALWRAVGIDTQRLPTYVVRGPTSRPNVQFMISRVAEASLQTYALRILLSHAFDSPRDRGIVFCETVEDATVLAGLIDAPFYVGQMDGEARTKALRRWFSGQSKWLCATSAFAQGIDYGYVTFVLHYRIPKHITLHSQQSGRLARQKGTSGISFLIFSDAPIRLNNSDVDLGGFNAMLDFATKDQCRRLSITAFLDSTPSNCTMLAECLPCDVCCRETAPLPLVHHPFPFPEVLSVRPEPLDGQHYRPPSNNRESAVSRTLTTATSSTMTASSTVAVRSAVGAHSSLAVAAAMPVRPAVPAHPSDRSPPAMQHPLVHNSTLNTIGDGFASPSRPSFTLDLSQRPVTADQRRLVSTPAVRQGNSLPKACSLSKVQKDTTVLRFLQECQGMCILHVISGGHASHKALRCEAWSSFLPSFKVFRLQIQFTTKGTCYRCGVPTSSKFDHPLRAKGDSGATCRFDDILKPLAWVVYSVPSLRDVVIEEAGASLNLFHSSEAYARWLGQVRVGSEVINLLEVCHAYVHLLSQNRLPQLTLDEIVACFDQDA